MKNIENERQLKNLANNVAWLRKKYKFSKKKMAELLCISVSSLNKLESGQIPQRLGVDILFKIWEHFGIKPCEIFANRFEE